MLYIIYIEKLLSFQTDYYVNKTIFDFKNCLHHHDFFSGKRFNYNSICIMKKMHHCARERLRNKRYVKDLISTERTSGYLPQRII